MSTLTSRNLAVGYERKIVIPELSLELSAGKFTAIVGANGCGKSTFLKALARLLRPLGGVVCLDATDIRMIPSRKLAQRLSILMQTSAAPDSLTVRDLVSYGRYPHTRWLGGVSAEDSRMVAWAIDVTGMNELAHRPVNSLSGGQQQRAWIAMTLAQGTEILLLDEPTNHLDLSHQLEIMELLLLLNRHEGKTVVIVLHDLNLAARYAEQIVVLHEGKRLAQGSPEEVITSDTLRKAFGIDAQIARDPRSGRPICAAYPLNMTARRAQSA